jgi:hypothetical protein
MSRVSEKNRQRGYTQDMKKLPIEDRKIAELARQARHCNVFPLFLSNVYRRDEAKHPVAALLKKLVPEAADYIGALDDREFHELVDSMSPGFGFMVGSGAARSSREERERVAIYYLGSEINRIYLSLAKVVNAPIEESEVVELYPELRERFDDDGLLYVDDRFTLHDGGIEYKQHMLHYHQFLRRGFTSNPNFDFLGAFARLFELTKDVNTFRIAIDHQRIMPLDAYMRLVEMDTWFGPRFDREKLDDRNAVGLTIVKRNQDSLFKLSNDLDRTEFFWSYRDGVKTLEVEEISNTGYRFEQFNLNRYLHAERDTVSRTLRHVDGAVKVYVHSDYPNRFESQMPREAKSHRKVKVWRIDGDVDVDHWLDLIAMFFKSNEMVIGYFDPERFEEVFDERVRDYVKWKADQAE